LNTRVVWFQAQIVPPAVWLRKYTAPKNVLTHACFGGGNCASADGT